MGNWASVPLGNSGSSYGKYLRVIPTNRVLVLPGGMALPPSEGGQLPGALTLLTSTPLAPGTGLERRAAGVCRGNLRH